MKTLTLDLKLPGGTSFTKKLLEFRWKYTFVLSSLQFQTLAKSSSGLSDLSINPRLKMMVHVVLTVQQNGKLW